MASEIKSQDMTQNIKKLKLTIKLEKVLKGQQVSSMHLVNTCGERNLENERLVFELIKSKDQLERGVIAHHANASLIYRPNSTAAFLIVCCLKLDELGIIKPNLEESILSIHDHELVAKSINAYYMLILGYIGTDKTIDALIKIPANESLTSVKLEALAVSGHPKGLDYVREAMESNVSKVSEYSTDVIRMLSSSNRLSEVNFLIELLHAEYDEKNRDFKKATEVWMAAAETLFTIALRSEHVMSEVLDLVAGENLKKPQGQGIYLLIRILPEGDAYKEALIKAIKKDVTQPNTVDRDNRMSETIRQLKNYPRCPEAVEALTGPLPK